MDAEHDANSSSDPRLQDQRTVIFSKTKMCKFHILSMCSKGTGCKFAHHEHELNLLPDLTCTKLCKTLLFKGACEDPQCRYAHSQAEMRMAPEESNEGATELRITAPVFEMPIPVWQGLDVATNMEFNIQNAASYPWMSSFCGAPNIHDISSISAPLYDQQTTQAHYGSGYHDHGRKGSDMSETSTEIPPMEKWHQDSAFSGMHSSSSSSSNRPPFEDDTQAAVSTEFDLVVTTPGVAQQMSLGASCRFSQMSDYSPSHLAAPVLGNGSVFIKNTFLEFGEQQEPIAPLRSVKTASGRLDCMG